MNTIKEILKTYDTTADSMEIGEHYEIETNGFEPLVIEKVYDNVLSVEQYYTQRMDRMSDPEIRFRIEDDGTWTPIEYTQHPHRYDRDTSGLSDVAGFVRKWDQNLEQQGFVEAARQAATGGEAR